MNHDALIHEIYAAATDAEAWATIPKAMCDSFGAATMLYADGYVADFSTYRIIRNGFEDEFLNYKGFTIADNFNPEVNLAFSACLTCKLTESFDGNKFYKDIRGRRRVFFQTCFVEAGIAYPRAFTLIRDGTIASGGFMARPTSAGPLEGREVRRFDSVLTHLRRATELKIKLETGRIAQQAIGTTLDRLAHAVFLVDRQLQILVCNNAAEEMQAAGDAVRTPRGRLRLRDIRADDELQRRMTKLYTTEDAAIEAPAMARRPSGAPPVAVSVYPATGVGAPVGALAAYACIVMSDPCADGVLPASADVEVALGLTPAEARVARLAPLALTTRRMAEHLGVSENTVKSHLASVRGKLGVARTSALARIVTRLPGRHPKMR